MDLHFTDSGILLRQSILTLSCQPPRLRAGGSHVKGVYPGQRIAGGPVGGMQAALTCSKMGHKVILCEKNERLGGVLRCEENVAFKKNLDYYLNQQAKCVEEDKNIELRLQTKVTPEYAEDLNADVIIAALGADQVVLCSRSAEGGDHSSCLLRT